MKPTKTIFRLLGGKIKFELALLPSTASPIGYPMPNFIWYMIKERFLPVLVPVYYIDLML